MVDALLDHPGGWYRATGGRSDRFYLELNTDGALAEEIRLVYWGEVYDEKNRFLINPVDRPPPRESLALKITPVAAR